MTPDSARTVRVPGLLVVVSELEVPVEGVAGLEAAFQDRLGDVDSFPGHAGLEVWKDAKTPGRYEMVTWWETPEAFRDYLRSDEHRRSHARIPTQPARPHGVRVTRYNLLSK